MINDICKAGVIEFLKKHKNPDVSTATTMYDGFVTCIKPIKGICGAELYCSPRTKPELIALIKEHS